MWFPSATRLPVRLLLLFGLLTVVPAIALAWLTLDLVRKDRELDAERLREQAADRIVAASHQRLADLESLASGIGALPPGVARVTVANGQIAVEPPDALAYSPDLPDDRDSSAAFAAGERFEYRDRSPVKAAEWFARLAAETTDPMLRGGALLRLARNQDKAMNVDAALSTYARLAAIDGEVEGTPAVLLAFVGRCTVLEGAGRTAELKETGKQLHDGLRSGRWRPRRATYESFLEQARRWSGEAARGDTENREHTAAAFAELYERWATDGAVAPRRWSTLGGKPVLTTGTGDARHLTALIATDEFLREAWRGIHGVNIVLSTSDGPILGTLAKNAPAAVRTPDVSGLPWTLRVSGDGATVNEPIGRRQLRVWGVGLVLLLIGGSAYVTWRGVSRELAVARLQTDFVAAVSHEFRTPLASLRHLSEMLARGRVAGEEQRQQCYDHLARESERLDRLVEELLDFGRLEEGQYRFSFAPVDLSRLVRRVADGFQEHAGARGHRIEFSGPGDGEAISMVDGEALTRALWNLFDNAAKYSPDCDTIWVELSLDEGEAVIRVRDRGLGIDAAERQQIFSKFVRGSNARARQVSGTGLGLAMVRYIVNAHSGEVTVESEPNKGSTFAVRLPVGAAA